MKTLTRTNIHIQKKVFLFLAVLPPFAAYVLFTLYPNVLSIYYSFLDWNGIGEKKYIGLDNYIRLFQDPVVLNALKHNLILVATVIPITLIISLVLADLLVNRQYKENKFYKVLFFFPNVLSLVVIALIWSFIYDGTFGLLNSVLRVLGIGGDHNWLGSPKTALASTIPLYVWCYVGFYVVIFMNAMSAIPKTIYESATLDGITSFQRFTKITLPLMSGIIRVGMIFLMLNVIKEFEYMFIMTKGGPGGATEVISLYMFNLAFGTESLSQHFYGYASTIGMLIFVLLVLLKVVIDKVFSKDSVEF
ncbi:carbohydrate ABC transporter permease [Paenibacillus agaridevorans]|uniref:carbohydrate ABC transporter permease n=1 Tax=Paenibacillus agaridevorans TaxID=171404 RepID=UPI001BE4184D|nr:sugar ABC transporter permease [Paenibacillus agaridevorans]